MRFDGSRTGSGVDAAGGGGPAGALSHRFLRGSDSPSANSARPPLSPLFSRRSLSRISENDLPMQKNALGMYTAAGIFFASIKLTIPLAYMYILLVLLRELSVAFPETVYDNLDQYIPPLAAVVSAMQKSSLFVEVWAVIEAIFYILLKLHIHWLQSKDPLEASLSAAPMLELQERRELWTRMMECEKDDLASFVAGWFFDADVETISESDVYEFGAWSMFEGRNLEHLTRSELDQLRGFVKELEWRIGIQTSGIAKEETVDKKKGENEGIHWEGEGQEEDGDQMEVADHGDPYLSDSSAMSRSSCSSFFSEDGVPRWHPDPSHRVHPCKPFKFCGSSHPHLDELEPAFFSSLYENFMVRYEQYRHIMENREFRPVQGLRNYMAERTRGLREAEECAINAASRAARELGEGLREAEESALHAASQMYENAYFTFVEKGSAADKRLSLLSQGARTQLTEAWNSVRSMKERLETAEVISMRMKALRQQLKGYRMLLDRMRSQAYAVPSKQMASVMMKITQCNDAMERVEQLARDGFAKATGYAGMGGGTGSPSGLFNMRAEEPKRFAKYSHDPLLGLSTYPLMFHILILGATDGMLRILMKRRGFERKRIGPISYYFHPGRSAEYGGSDRNEDPVPVIFCHGIGVGLIYYLSLIDSLLISGRPLFLPEIPYVSGFRPWQSPNSILPPAAVTSTLSAMLATHGYLSAAFIGHSYGTSWLSYVCKYAPSVVEAVLFLDPICFCLHYACLTKHFVYHRADPGSTSYMIRTDVMINWTIQRSFPWTRISLFIPDQLPSSEDDVDGGWGEGCSSVPCAVFLSEHDVLVPTGRVLKYLASKGSPVRDYDGEEAVARYVSDVVKGPSSMSPKDEVLPPASVTLFRGLGHGDWIDDPVKCQGVAGAMDALCGVVEGKVGTSS